MILPWSFFLPPERQFKFDFAGFRSRLFEELAYVSRLLDCLDLSSSSFFVVSIFELQIEKIVFR